MFVIFFRRRLGLLLDVALASLVKGATWHAKLDVIQVDGAVLITDDHIVVGFNCHALVVANENPQTSDDVLVLLVCLWFPKTVI